MPHRARPDPFLRLVVDNSCKAHLGSVIPSFLALNNSSPRQEKGIWPRNRHMETVLGCNSSGHRSARADGPPNKEITSRLLSMRRRHITFYNVLQAPKGDTAKKLPFSHHVRMDQADTRWVEEAQAQSVQNIIWLEQRSSLERQAFAKRMGLTYGAYKNALERSSFRTINLVKLSRSMDVSLDFICGLTADIRPLNPQTSREKTFWELTQEPAGDVTAPAKKRAKH